MAAGAENFAPPPPQTGGHPCHHLQSCGDSRRGLHVAPPWGSRRALPIKGSQYLSEQSREISMGGDDNLVMKYVVLGLSLGFGRQGYSVRH